MKGKGVTAEETAAGAERRAAPRVLVDLEVDYASEDNYLFAYITDISATGIFIRTVAPEPAGTRLNLRFSRPRAEGEPDASDGEPDDGGDDDRVGAPLDDARRFELEGEVIWVNPYRPGQPASTHPGMGVRFVGLGDRDRARLIELVRRFAYLT